MPAEAGIQFLGGSLGPRFRGDERKKSGGAASIWLSR